MARTEVTVGQTSEGFMVTTKNNSKLDPNPSTTTEVYPTVQAAAKTVRGRQRFNALTAGASLVGAGWVAKEAVLTAMRARGFDIPTVGKVFTEVAVGTLLAANSVDQALEGVKNSKILRAIRSHRAQAPGR